MGKVNSKENRSFVLMLVVLVLAMLCQGLAHAATGAVPLNSQNGASTLSRTDLSLGRTFPIDITRQYNSRSGYASALGYGWALSFDKQLYTYSDNSVVIRTGPGQKKKYTASGSTFTSPAGDTGVLTFDSAGGTYTYTSVDGTRELFDSYGRLTGITDPKGSSVALSYVSTTKAALKGLLPANVDQSAATVIAYAYQLSRIEERNSAGTASTVLRGSFVKSCSFASAPNGCAATASRCSSPRKEPARPTASSNFSPKRVSPSTA